MASLHSIPSLMIALSVLIMPVYCQISTPCTASMLTTFTPCMNFITNSTTNGTSPTAACCSSLQSLMSTGTDCMCLIATGSVPFQIPINRTLALSLPRACNMPGVPLQCKASGSPMPAPGPVAFGSGGVPSLSPTAGTTVPETVSPALSPESDTNVTPANPTVQSEAPTNAGIRPVLTPSSAKPSLSFSPLLVLAMLGAIVLKYY